MRNNYDDGFEDGILMGLLMGDDRDGKDGCYIATSVYGSYDCPEVWVLRRFRDDRLKRTAPGRAFVRSYYAVSPTLVRFFGGVGWLKEIVRRPLDRLVCRLMKDGVSDEPYEDAPQTRTPAALRTP